jgi:uncharacterized protein
MHSLDNPELRQALQDFLKQRTDTFSWVETHGLLCAIAAGPEPETHWQTLIFLEDIDTLPDKVSQCLTQLTERIASTLGAGEGVTLPCRLDPYEEKDGEDLAAWCTGFLAAVFSQETAWYGEREEQMANLLLPILLISGLDEDEALNELWQNTQLVRKMALGVPDLVEELFLHFHAPDLPEEDGED